MATEIESNTNQTNNWVNIIIAIGVVYKFSQMVLTYLERKEKEQKAASLNLDLLELEKERRAIELKALHYLYDSKKFGVLSPYEEEVQLKLKKLRLEVKELESKHSVSDGPRGRSFIDQSQRNILEQQELSLVTARNEHREIYSPGSLRPKTLFTMQNEIIEIKTERELKNLKNGPSS